MTTFHEIDYGKINSIISTLPASSVQVELLNNLPLNYYLYDASNLCLVEKRDGNIHVIRPHISMKAPNTPFIEEIFLSRPDDDYLYDLAEDKIVYDLSIRLPEKTHFSIIPPRRAIKSSLIYLKDNQFFKLWGDEGQHLIYWNIYFISRMLSPVGNEKISELGISLTSKLISNQYGIPMITNTKTFNLSNIDLKPTRKVSIPNQLVKDLDKLTEIKIVQALKGEKTETSLAIVENTKLDDEEDNPKQQILPFKDMANEGNLWLSDIADEGFPLCDEITKIILDVHVDGIMEMYCYKNEVHIYVDGTKYGDEIFELSMEEFLPGISGMEIFIMKPGETVEQIKELRRDINDNS